MSISNQDYQIIELDSAGQPIVPTMILATKGGSKLGVIFNVSDFNYRPAMNEVDEISFTVTKFRNGEECALWDKITDFKLVCLPQYESWFEITVTINEDNETVKSVSGLHAQEAELSQRLIFETEINTEDDIARDDYRVTIFYDEDHPEGSLLNRLLADKGQDYTIQHVDHSLRNLQRTFNFNNKSIHDCFNEVAKEFECLFVYGEYPDNDGEYHRTISAYDLLDYCNTCNERGDFSEGVCTECGSHSVTPGYGDDTGIFISSENIAKSVSLRSNADSVKNCFRLEAGDDVMTAVVRTINPSGSQYIWNFTDEMRADMSDELQSALREYDQDYEYYRSQHNVAVPEYLVDQYNYLVGKYGSYNEDLEEIEFPIVGSTSLTEADYKARYMYDFLKNVMMPGSSEVQDTTAQEQIANLTVANLSPISVGPDKNLEYVSLSTADNAVVLYSKVYVDTARYRITVGNSSFDNNIWRGTILVESYTNTDDTAQTEMLTLAFNTVDADYIKQSVEKMIKQNETKGMGAVAMFKMTPQDFSAALGRYCLKSLETFRDICDACMNVMIEQGISEDAEQDVYTQLYLPYYIKSNIIENELRIRESELNSLLAPSDEAEPQLIDYIEKLRGDTARYLDIKTYIGDELWKELMSFRRDDTYQNSNFISDGLTDAELVENARNFLKTATHEIIKSSTVQNSLSGKLQDFLLMPEFEPLVYHFEVGNKIFVEIDGKVYKLRMTSYELNFDNLQSIEIDFSDIVKVGNIVSDTKSILDKARSIATSYDSTKRQAEKGKVANDYYTDMATRGLDLTTNKIVNSADSQDVVYDRNGLLMRRKDDFEDSYSLEQVKIINKGLYYTNDGWRTSSAGIGHFKYIDPETGQETDGYGVIADTVMGNLILGNDLKIYNENGGVIMDGDGTIFTIKQNQDNTGLFKIRKQNPNGTYTDLIYVDGSGNLVIQGTSIRIGGGDLATYIDEAVSDSAGAISINLSNEYIGVSTDYDGTGGDFTDVYVDVTVERGIMDITDDVTFLITPSASVTGTWDSNNHRYSVSALSDDEGTVVFTIYYRDITLSKTFKVAKVRNGNGESALNVVIDSSAGILFKNSNINSILRCYVYSGTRDITNSVTSFDWYRVLPDGTRDQSWSRIGAGNIITITSADVVSKAVFRCDVTL